MSKTAKGFKALKGVLVTDIKAKGINQVMIYSGDIAFVIDAEVVDGLPIMSCAKLKHEARKPVKRKGETEFLDEPPWPWPPIPKSK
jgi:hypothetical protein